MRDLLDLATEDPIGIELLKDFVARPEDVLAIMGIFGAKSGGPSKFRRRPS